MITKAKKVQFTTSDGKSYETIEEAKEHELNLLIGDGSMPSLVQKSREAIAILRMGLPRKPRTVKAKTVRAKKQTATQPA